MENFKNENIINIEENEDKNNDQDNDDISISTQLLNTKQENNEIKKNDYYNDDLVIDWGTPKYHRIILKERIEKKNKENAKEITGRQFLKRKRNKERQMKKRKHKIEDKRAKSNYYQIKEEKENDIRRKSFAKFDDIKLTECLVKGENSYINDFLDSYRDNMQKITQNLLLELKERVKKLNIDISFSPEAVSALAEEGYSKTYGARPLRRLIQTKVEDEISEKMLRKEIKPKDKVTINYDSESKMFVVVKQG